MCRKTLICNGTKRPVTLTTVNGFCRTTKIGEILPGAVKEVGPISGFGTEHVIIFLFDEGDPSYVEKGSTMAMHGGEVISLKMRGNGGSYCLKKVRAQHQSYSVT